MRKEKRAPTFRPGRVTRLDGVRFGELLVLRRASSHQKFASWLCRCSCGVEIVVPGDKLRRGKRKTCALHGHRFKKKNAGGITILYRAEYQSWANMHERCCNAKHIGFAHYGTRGITVCERWNDFKNFLMDMGKKPAAGLTIDRRDPNGNYEPGNCQWISKKDQTRNKRNSIFVTYQGRKLLLIDLVEELGLSRSVVYGRLKIGWPLDVALAIPLQSTGRPSKIKLAERKSLLIKPNDA